MAGKTAFFVKCPAYTAGPLTSREAAERRLQGIQDQGACHEAHEITEVSK